MIVFIPYDDRKGDKGWLQEPSFTEDPKTLQETWDSVRFILFKQVNLVPEYSGPVIAACVHAGSHQLIKLALRGILMKREAKDSGKDMGEIRGGGQFVINWNSRELCLFGKSDSFGEFGRETARAAFLNWKARNPSYADFQLVIER